MKSRSGTKVSRVAATALAVLLTFGAGSAFAAEIRVLSAGAYHSVLQALAPAFEQRSGHRLVIQVDTVGALKQRIAGGQAFDVAVLTPAALGELGEAAQGARVAAGSIVKLARVGIGVAIQKGAPIPDIGSVAALQTTLTHARAVATVDPAAGGSSGIYLWQWFEQVGIADQLRSRAVLVRGGLAAQRLVSGEADIALQQISELIAVPGATLVGPLPAAIQHYTVYAGGVSASTREGAAARSLLDWLAAASAAATLKDKGMEAP